MKTDNKRGSSRRDFVKQGVGATAAIAGLGANTAAGINKEKPTALPSRTLGNTGQQLPILGFGGAALPKKWHNNLSYQDRIKLVRHAYERGVRYFDTSISYSYAESQEIIGKALKPVRDQVYIVTKVDFWDVTKPDGRFTSLPKGEAMRQVKMNLKELGSDYIDAILIHGTPGVQQMTIEQNLEVAADLLKARDAGLVRHVGFSAHGYFDKSLALIKSDLFDLCMLSYGYLPRGHDQTFSPETLKLREACIAEAHKRKMGIVAMKVVGAGMMGGWAPYVVPGTSQQLVRDMPGAAIRWTLNDKRIDLLCIGMRNPSEVDQNVNTLSADLSYSKEDDALLKSFSTKVMASDSIKKMKVE